jgi:hypothetical protein
MPAAPATVIGPAAAAWDSLDQLAAIVRAVHGLQACLLLADDGAPELYVSGPSGMSRVLAGSVHYWQGGGDGPIGLLTQPGQVAGQIAASCGAADGGAGEWWVRDASVTLDSLRFHWSAAYEIRAQNGRCTAVPRFGEGETLTASEPAGLLQLIRRHYPGRSARSSAGPRTPG